MQRVLYLQLLSKKLSSKSISISSKPFFSLHKTANSSPPHHQFFSQYTTWSCRPQNRGFSDRIPNGFFSNPLLAKQFLQRTTLKGFDSTVGFLRVQFSRRNYHSNFSFDSNRRGRSTAAVTVGYFFEAVVSLAIYRGRSQFFRLQSLSLLIARNQDMIPSGEVKRKFGFQRLTTDGLVLGLILTNVAVFMLWRIADHKFMIKNFMISLDNLKSGCFHTLITSAFSHEDLVHLISNMVGLYFFGTSIGRVFGPEYLLKLYLAGAVAGSVFFLVQHAFMALSSKRKQMLSNDPSKTYALGASGAVNAVILLDIFLFPTKPILLNFFIPVPAVLMGIFLIGQDLMKILEGDSQISGSAHLGGAAVAAVAWLQIRKGRFRF